MIYSILHYGALFIASLFVLFILSAIAMNIYEDPKMFLALIAIFLTAASSAYALLYLTGSL